MLRKIVVGCLQISVVYCVSLQRLDKESEVVWCVFGPWSLFRKSENGTPFPSHQLYDNAAIVKLNFPLFVSIIHRN